MAKFTSKRKETVSPHRFCFWFFFCFCFFWGKAVLRNVFPVGSVVMNLPARAEDAGDMGSLLGLGRFPGGGNGNPLQYSCLENPKDTRAWRATVSGVAKSQTQLSMHTCNTQKRIFHFQLQSICKSILYSLFWKALGAQDLLDQRGFWKVGLFPGSYLASGFISQCLGLSFIIPACLLIISGNTLVSYSLL